MTPRTGMSAMCYFLLFRSRFIIALTVAVIDFIIYIGQPLRLVFLIH